MSDRNRKRARDPRLNPEPDDPFAAVMVWLNHIPGDDEFRHRAMGLINLVRAPAHQDHIETVAQVMNQMRNHYRRHPQPDPWAVEVLNQLQAVMDPHTEPIIQIRVLGIYLHIAENPALHPQTPAISGLLRRLITQPVPQLHPEFIDRMIHLIFDLFIHHPIAEIIPHLALMLRLLDLYIDMFLDAANMNQAQREEVIHIINQLQHTAANVYMERLQTILEEVLQAVEQEAADAHAADQEAAQAMAAQILAFLNAWEEVSRSSKSAQTGERRFRDLKDTGTSKRRQGSGGAAAKSPSSARILFKGGIHSVLTTRAGKAYIVYNGQKLYLGLDPKN